MNRLELELTLNSDAAEICTRALSLESSHHGTKKSDVEFSYSGDKLKMIVSAEDLSTLRASLNTYLRLIIMCSTLIS